MQLQGDVRLLNQREAAATIGIHARTLRQAIKAGCGPALTLINRRQFVRSDCLAAWIEANTAASPATATSFTTAAEALAALADSAGKQAA